MQKLVSYSILSSALLFLVGVLYVGCSESPTAPLPETSSELSAAKHIPGTTGKAMLHPENQSGVQGRITFTDDGTTLTIHGTATGLTPGIPYASLIYDNKSVPGGPEACEPMIFDPTDPDFILPTMFVGFWAVDAAGNGTLWEVNIFDEVTGTRVYVPLSKFKTISIRDLTVDGPFGPGSGPLAVVACGEEATHGQR